ncbi:unnamed protein product [Phytophthora fragariaefolia]|uniref:Unnamed protein product n=1 Tax=Phytophthora fragariaefolia TaxID=1490495 RepID=A0A9W7CVH9_9STRA|nr:unnamed protein product [Phytophthora fragariaefolia]
MLEKLIRFPETKIQVDTQVFQSTTRLHTSWSPRKIVLDTQVTKMLIQQPKYPVYPRSFRPIHEAPGTCQVRHAADQDANPSNDLSSLWSQKPQSIDRANRSQDPAATPAINDECAATQCSTWRSSIEESSHSEKAHVFRAQETVEDPDTKKD